MSLFQIVFGLGIGCALYLCVLLSPVFVFAWWTLLFGTGTVIVMLLAMRNISGRVILSIGSLLKLGFAFSVFVFCWVVHLSPLAIDIV